VELVPALKNSLPANPDRFATLLGMLLTESRQSKHAIDFLHPRHRAEAPSRRKMWVLAGTTIAILGLAYLVWARVDSFLLANEIEEKTTESRLLEPEVVKAKKVIAVATEIGKWADADAVWLDQLRGLCEVFPAAKDAVLTELIFDVKPLQQGGRQMTVKGRARNHQVVTEMLERIRESGGQMIGGPPNLNEDRTAGRYPCSFEARMLLKGGPKP
jgi:Tfp pilus assembly protein PilN